MIVTVGLISRFGLLGAEAFRSHSTLIIRVKFDESGGELLLALLLFATSCQKTSVAANFQCCMSCFGVT